MNRESQLIAKLARLVSEIPRHAHRAVDDECVGQVGSRRLPQLGRSPRLQYLRPSSINCLIVTVPPNVISWARPSPRARRWQPVFAARAGATGASTATGRP